MIKIKNINAGRVLIPDAGLRFLPGQVVSVESISPQTQDMIAKGYLVRLGDAPAAVPDSDTGDQAGSGGAPAIREDYDSLHAADAIEYVSGLSDPRQLRAALKREKRKTVIEAINERLAELG